MKVLRRLLLTAPFVAAVLLFLFGQPKNEQRDRSSALRRALHFIYSTARDPSNFAENGADFLWCFSSLSAATADPQLKSLAWRMGQERARVWRSKHPRVPENANEAVVTDLAFGSFSADTLGITGHKMKEDLRRIVPRFPPEAFLRFDPAKEPPPEDIPRRCSKCKTRNPRGSKTCVKCGARLEMIPAYDILCDALITSYSGDRYGIPLGGSYADVAQWISRFRPHRWEPKQGRIAFESISYTITHLIYTLNDYSLYRLRPEWLPVEYEWLRTHLRSNITGNDPETLGEFIDTLKSFGLTEADPLIREGIEFLLERQNADGSWGAVRGDFYSRYHTTWTAIGGVMEYAWRGEGVTFPEALRRLRP